MTAVVNAHYLNKVIELSDAMPVIATEDVYDARGNKLLAKGARVTQALQEKLILHKLTKPIETSLSVQGGVNANLIVQTTERLLDTNKPLASVMAVCSGMGPSPAALFSPLQFGGAMTMMLTIIDRAGGQAFEHAVTVGILATCFAKQMKLNVEAQQHCALAGLLHDIGELYIDPAFFTPGRPLLPHEWAHLVVHPKTGQMLIDEFDHYPKEVGRAVAEHHERLDGSGYPRRAQALTISPIGQALAAAESVSGMLNAEHGLERAELALKLMVREHDKVMLNTVAKAKRHLREEVREPFEAVAGVPTTELYQHIGTALEMNQALASATGLSAATKATLATVGERLQLIQRAAISLGLNVSLIPEGTDSFDGLLLFEYSVASREIRWRLRDLGRELALLSCTQGEHAILQTLTLLLHPPLEPAAAAA